MGRVVGHFRGLQWRLTLSYTALSVAAVLALGLAFLSIVNRWIVDSTDFPSILATTLSDVTPQAAPYLQRNPIDQVGLTHWLTGGTWQRSMHLPFDIDVASGPTALVVVVDRNGRIVGTTNSRLATPNETLADHLPAGPAGVLRAALAGELDRSRLGLREPNGEPVAAAPIIGSDGQTLGAFFLAPNLSALSNLIWARAVSGLLASAIALTVLFGLLGTLFGFVWARWLTRRLRVLNGAVDAWSRGDLAVIARDASGDELGQLARQLNRMAEQLRALLQTRQALAVVEERQRLARDLHDALKQQVFATAMQVGAARALLDRDPAAAQTHLVEAERLAGQAQQELNTLIRELRPAALIDKGLVAALDEWVRDWSRQTTIDAELRVQGARATPLAVEQAVFRIAQEALANVARHSGAAAVDVHLAWTDDALTLGISDNGRGFDVGQALGRGMGRSSMRERVEAIGGTLTIRSDDEGTRLVAQVPQGASHD